MEITTTREGGLLVAAIEGRIDSRNAQEFETTIQDAIKGGDGQEQATSVLLDLENLSYISSAGLRVIMVIAKRMQKDDEQFALCTLQESIQEIMDISGFSRIIKIHPSQLDAREALRGGA